MLLMENRFKSITFLQGYFYFVTKRAPSTSTSCGAFLVLFIMAKDFALAFYHSKQWQDCRKSFIKERVALDGGICQRCHEELGYIVHHKIHLTPGNIQEPSIALNHKNLEYVCKRCHDEEHFFPRCKPLLCKFDERGRPINGKTQECNKG